MKVFLDAINNDYARLVSEEDAMVQVGSILRSMECVDHVHFA